VRPLDSPKRLAEAAGDHRRLPNPFQGDRLNGLKRLVEG
jgi:hypothetical protein